MRLISRHISFLCSIVSSLNTPIIQILTIELLVPEWNNILMQARSKKILDHHLLKGKIGQKLKNVSTYIEIKHCGLSSHFNHRNSGIRLLFKNSSQKHRNSVAKLHQSHRKCHIKTTHFCQDPQEAARKKYALENSLNIIYIIVEIQ